MARKTPLDALFQVRRSAEQAAETASKAAADALRQARSAQETLDVRASEARKRMLEPAFPPRASAAEAQGVERFRGRLRDQALRLAVRAAEHRRTVLVRAVRAEAAAIAACVDARKQREVVEKARERELRAARRLLERRREDG